MREHGAGVNRVAHLDLERAGPQMRVGGEMSVAEIQDDVIAGESLGRSRHRDPAAVGDVLGNPVLDRDDLSVRDRVEAVMKQVAKSASRRVVRNPGS